MLRLARDQSPKAPFYLVGSIHALSKKDYPLPSPYELALRDSRRFVFEFDPNRRANSKGNLKQPANILPDGYPFKD